MKILLLAMVSVIFLPTSIGLAGVDSGFPGKGNRVEQIDIPQAYFQDLIRRSVDQVPLVVTIDQHPGEELEALGINLKARTMALRSVSEKGRYVVLKETSGQAVNNGERRLWMESLFGSEMILTEP